MRRYAWTLMVPMFLGCSGANVVSGEDKTEAEKLAADLPSWCEKTCNRFSACDGVAGEDCNCSGDVCDCTSSNVGDDCPQECQETLSDFSKTTEACADVGRRYQDCIDTLGCSDLESEPACLPSRAELEACEIDEGDDEPPQVGGTGGSTSSEPGPSAGGSVGYAGTASGGYAGTGNGGVNPVGPVVTCESGFGSGGSGTAGSANLPTGPSVTCQEGRADCSDGHEYSWICLDDAAGHNWCSCFVDNTAVGALPSDGICPSVEQVNAACGWNLSSDF